MTVTHSLCTISLKNCSLLCISSWIRLIAIVQMCVPVTRSPAVDAYGFERPEDFDYKSYDEFMSHYVKVLGRRAGRWATLLDGNDQLTHSQKCKSV